jgi:hypothetical protein
MTTIIIPRKHLEQPRGRLTVSPEWAHRLVSLIYFGEGKPLDLIDTRASFNYSGSAVVSPHRDGVGMRTTSSTGYAESTGALAGWTGNSTLAFFIPEIGATQDTNGAMLYAIPAQTNYTQISADGTGIWNLGAGSPKALGEDIRGTRNRTLVVRGAGSDPAIFIDRKKVSSTNGSIGSGAKTVRIGAWSSSGYQFNGVMGSVAVIPGPMTDEESMEMAVRPWMFYHADPIRIYSLPSGGLPTSLSVAVSNITASGARNTVTLGF